MDRIVEQIRVRFSQLHEINALLTAREPLNPEYNCDWTHVADEIKTDGFSIERSLSCFGAATDSKLS